MVFYIDPGTGSMLFTILIGLAGAAIYAARGLFLKGKVALGGGRKAHKNDGKEEIVFFTDSKRYENIFRPLCDEMEKRGIVSAKDGAKPRICLITREDYEKLKDSGSLIA